jgi:hypothetical protein
MNASPAPEVSPPLGETAAADAYRWLLILGFPPDAAAASLMPNLFTARKRRTVKRRWRPSIRRKPA